MEIIRLSGFLAKVPLRMKLEVLEKIYHENQQFSVRELCEAQGVARGTFYNHIFRRADRSKREEEQAELMLRVQQIFDDSQQRFVNTPPETVPLDRTNGALRPLKWCMVTAVMVH